MKQLAALALILTLSACASSGSDTTAAEPQDRASSISDDERGYRAGYSGCAGIFPRTQDAFDERARSLGKQAALDGEPIEYAEGMSRGCVTRYLDED